MGFVVPASALFLRLVHPNAEHPRPTTGPGPVGYRVGLARDAGVRRGDVAAPAVLPHPHPRASLTATTAIEPGLVLGFGVALAGLVLAAVLVV